MRTTVSIDDELLETARERAQQRGVTLGRLVEDALRRELAAPARTDHVELPVMDGGRPAPGLDLMSNRAIHEFLDEGLPLHKRR